MTLAWTFWFLVNFDTVTPDSGRIMTIEKTLSRRSKMGINAMKVPSVQEPRFAGSGRM